MVLFSILIQDEKDFDFDKQIFRHYKRMIGMVQNFIWVFSFTQFSENFSPTPTSGFSVATNGSPSKTPTNKTPLVELLFIFRH